MLETEPVLGVFKCSHYLECVNHGLFYIRGVALSLGSFAKAARYGFFPTLL